MSANGTLVEDKMRGFKGECAHFSFNKYPIYTHDGASAKFSTNSHETDNSVYNNHSDCVSVSVGNSRGNDDFKDDHTISLPLCKHRQDATSLSLLLIFLLSVW